MTYENMNRLFNAIADEQKIPVGSPQWIKGGLQPFSGTTGGHPAYGWRFHHLIKEGGEDYARAVIANYGHRRCYYNNAPARKGGYDNGGRPIDWLPEDERDTPKGSVIYDSVIDEENVKVTVSGPDILHFHIGPLIAVYDTPGLFVQAQGAALPARLVAGVMINELFEALIGMFYLSATKYNPLPSFADRGYACLLKATAEVVSRNLGSNADSGRLYTYLDNVVLKFYETAPGHLNLAKGSPMPGVPHFQLYNGLYWLLPSFYDVWQITKTLYPTHAVTNRFETIVVRLSQWMLDLEMTMPGVGGRIASVCISDPEFLKGDNGKPWQSWAKFLKPECIFGYGEKPGTDWSAWGLRAQLVAAKVLNSSLLLDTAEKTIQRLKEDDRYDHRAWLVDADGNYI